MLLGLGCMEAAMLKIVDGSSALQTNIQTVKVECAQKSGGVHRHKCFWGCSFQSIFIQSDFFAKFYRFACLLRFASLFSSIFIPIFHQYSHRFCHVLCSPILSSIFTIFVIVLSLFFHRFSQFSHCFPLSSIVFHQNFAQLCNV